MFSRRFLLEETIMRLLIQRVLEAKVTVDGDTTGENSEKGFLFLLELEEKILRRQRISI